MYTKEQIEEIGKRLGLLGIKDTQFPPTVPIDGTEVLTVVQSGENRAIRLDNLCREMAQYIITAVLNQNPLPWFELNNDGELYAYWAVDGNIKEIGMDENTGEIWVDLYYEDYNE